MGRCEVFNTPNGQILWTLLNAGVILGMSTRALGDEEYSEGVRHIKKEGFDFIAADCVVDASAIGAGYKEMTESTKKYFKESLKMVKYHLTDEIIRNIDQVDIKVQLESVKKESEKKLEESNKKLEEAGAKVTMK